MSDSGDVTLLGKLRWVLSLPASLKDIALRDVLEEWNASPLVADVMAGKTTFEKEIAPLVDENRKLFFWNHFGGKLCNSQQYSEIVKRIQGIVSLRYSNSDLSELVKPFDRGTISGLLIYFFIIAFGVMCAFVVASDSGVVCAIMLFVFCSSIVTLFAIALSCFFFRIEDAEKVLRDAKYLDSIFDLVVRAGNLEEKDHS